MIKRIGHFINIILLSLAVLTIGSCDRHGTAWNEMDKAENLMDAKPDSALVVLENIPASSVKGKEAAARYALLKSIALDKNYIDTTNFDVLQPAIDYYIKNGKPDEKLRTYYYQGRIYQNQGDDDSAMRSFMNGCDLRHGVTDSLLLAHTLVAQGTLYFKQYKINDFVHYNMEAAKLYEAIGKDILAIKSYTNALDGYIMMEDKSAADSILSICVPLVQKNPDGEAYLFPSLLSYTIGFCPPDDIKAFLDEYQNMELTTDETMIFAEGYSKIGEYDKAMTIISNINPAENTWDSLKYASIKIDILERQGKYKQAFTLYRDYSASLERHQKELLSQDLLFADKKHQLEMKSLMEIQDRDRIIWGTLCGIFGLVILVGWLYYRGYRSKTKRILAEKENKNLRLEQENLRLEIDQLENERDNLKELQKEQSELSKPIKDVIKNRLDLLNGLLAKEITNNDRYAEPYNKWIDTVRNDKKKFMDSTRLAFAASHPKFMEYLEQHGLSTDEINYLCLYAIGLRGKEVGEYIQTKRHYIVSHEIRKKFGIDEHETNIDLYIRRLMKDFEK
ncbi:hypothetical protein [uncultured Prevotella sp.]|uniref:hypothetical protein n=1 Tax=uncultured Prevotella sp. TaxID=159272 RepID=UPI00266C1B7C|nr:hypothetical protein [uncultured Prevotella sp.]